MISPYLTGIICLECGHEQPASAVMAVACPECGSAWLDARYNYDAVRERWQHGLGRRPHSLWRYAELLPIEFTHPELSMGEGDTPLSRLYPYELLYNHAPIFVKDERAQPTNSFKDRQAALSVMAMKQHGITEIVLASTGNAAVAYAAYCARAGIKLWLFLTSLVPAEKMREAALYGCEVVKVSGTYDETKKVAAEFAQRKGIHFDRGAKAVPGKESMKTLAFEIAEGLGLYLYPDEPKWVAPDWYIQAVSGGIGPLGVYKGFSELHQMGLIDKIPKLGIIQAAGCSPMVQAFEAKNRVATPVVPQTLITVLATGEPGYAYTLLYDAIQATGGTMLALTDGETFTAMRRAASRGGMSVEPATAVAFGGLEKMLTEGIIANGERVVVNCSGHTFPAESHILGDQYEQYILDLEVNRAAGREASPHTEGLGAALKNLDEQVTTIVVVDDNPHDRRLIRRLLQSHKRYRVYEARDGMEALQVIKDRQPDYVITDLTMPDMDGFMLLETLKQDEMTAGIPVLVVSAKDLTHADRRRLEAYDATILTKGGGDTREIVRQVTNTLGHKTLEVIGEPEPPGSVRDVPPPWVEGESTHTIVVIDDNPLDVRLAKRIIASGGDYAVIDANTGRDGLKAIYSHHPDLIILDLVLPDMDGFTLLEILQNDPHLREIPVIVYSGTDIKPEERERLQKHIRWIVSKADMSREELLSAIKDELVQGE